jgi:uncharacterized protein YdiU (UPF0061 family)
MAKKLGLKAYDKALTVGLLQLMVEAEADFTNTFRALADLSVESWEVRLGEARAGLTAPSLSVCG